MVLAIARRAFATAGLASILLDENTVPARDAYQAAEHECQLALSLLDKALGPQLVKRYSASTRKADIAELHLSNDADIEVIAGGDDHPRGDLAGRAGRSRGRRRNLRRACEEWPHKCGRP